MTNQLTDSFAASFESGLKQPAPDWYQLAKNAAWEEFQKNGLPSRKDPDWIYTSLKFLQNKVFKRSLAKDGHVDLSQAQTDRIRKQCKSDAINLVLINGRFVPELSDHLKLSEDQGFYCDSIAKTLGQNPQRLSKIISEMHLVAKDNGLTSLNEALGFDGFVLSVDEDKALHSPVHVLNFYESEARDSVQLNCPRFYIHLQKHSSLRLYEEHFSLSPDADTHEICNNAVCEVILQEGAKLRYRQILTAPGSSSVQILHTRVLQSAHSHFDSFSVCSGGQLVRHSQQIWQREPEAFSRLNGLFLGHDSRQCEQLTEVNHGAPYGQSEQLFKGVLPGESTGVFLGTVRVAKDAQKVQAKQLSKSLLCSLSAKAHSRPQLEIDADDVKCSHGSTVSQLRDEELFYCQSRGIKASDARALLSLAFAEDVLLQCQDALLDDLVKPLMTSFRGSVTQMRKTQS